MTAFAIAPYGVGEETESPFARWTLNPLPELSLCLATQRNLADKRSAVVQTGTADAMGNPIERAAPGGFRVHFLSLCRCHMVMASAIRVVYLGAGWCRLCRWLKQFGKLRRAVRRHRTEARSKVQRTVNVEAMIAG